MTTTRSMRSVRTHDAPMPLFRRHGKFLTRDLRLEALTPGKQQVSWMTWEGALAPVVNDVVSAVGTIYDGPGLGQPFSAEPGPASAILLGEAFDGAFRRIIAAVDAARRSGTGDDVVDVGELMENAENLQEALEDGDKAGAKRAFDALKRTRDGINAKHAKARSGDGVAPRRTTGGFSKPKSVAQINGDNSKFWQDHEAAR